MNSFPSDAGRVPPALLSPEPTAEKMVRRYNRSGHRPGRAVPGLDPAALAHKYGGDPANTKQTIAGVFRVRLGASWDEYRRVRDRSLSIFCRVLEARGYRLIPRRGAVRVAPGVYPAKHPETGVDLLDQREFRVEVDCSAPNAEPVVIELEPDDLAPTVVDTRRT